MQYLSPEEFEKKYGTQQKNLVDAVSEYKAPKPGLFSRIGQDIQAAGEDVRAQLTGEGAYGEQSTLKRATGATKSLFGAIPKVASEFLPEPAREGLKTVGEGVGSAINYLGEKLGNVEAVHNFVINNPEAAQKLIDSLGIVQDVGSISGDILTAEGIASGATKAFRAVSGTTKEITKSVASLTEGVKGKLTPTSVDKVSEFLSPQLSGKAAKEAIKTGKVVEAQGFGSRDFSKTVQDLDEMKIAVREVPGINKAKTNLEASNLIGEHNKNIHSSLMDQLAKERAFSNPNVVRGRMSNVRAKLFENPTMVGDALSAGEKIISRFEKFVEEYGYTGEGVMKARIALDKWAGAGKKFSTQATSGATEALRAVRDAANDIASELSPNTATKAMLRKQTMLHRAQEIVASKAVKEGSTKVQQFMKKHPILTKTTKIATGGTIAGKAARLAE